MSKHQAPQTYSFKPAVVRPKNAAIILNVSHKKLYELIKAGDLVSYTEGSARKITMASIEAYIARKVAEAGR